MHKNIIFLDVHVHIYNCFNIQKFFDSAHENFLKHSNKLGFKKKVTAIVCLTDWAGENWYKKLHHLTDGNQKNHEIILEGWNCSKTSEKNAFIASKDSLLDLYVVAGRKIITTENIEVLALGIGENCIPNALTLENTVRSIKKYDGISVIPWAFGKWFGKRGKVVEKLISFSNGKDFFLCDNGNRPFFWPWPRHFMLAQKKGINILSGSDPLHFSSEENKAGNFGAYIEGTIASDFPVSELKKLLLISTMPIQLYGKLEKFYKFVYHQTLMQVFKKKWKTKINL